jgi:hypothetical protein
MRGFCTALPPPPMQAPGIGAMVKKKSAVPLTSKTHSAARLERLSCQFGVPVDDESAERILATIDLAKTTVLLPGIDAAKLDATTAAAIKRARWGGSVRSMLSFLGAIVHLRKLSTREARKEIVKFAKTFAQTGDRKTALALAKMALEQAQAKAIDARAWNNERIAGEYLPTQYHVMFGKPPKKTRPKLARGKLRGKLEVQESETVRFIQAVLSELGISYSRESIIAAIQGATRPKRRR